MFDCGVHPAHSGMSCLPYFDHINPAEAPVESLKACEIRSYPPAVVEGISILLLTLTISCCDIPLNVC